MLEPLLKLGRADFKRKTFSCQWKPFFLKFLARRSNFFVSWNRIFIRMLLPGSGNVFFVQYKPFFIFFQRLLRRKAFFLSCGNVFSNECFILAIGERFFCLMETVTLLESFFVLAETVTAMSGNQFLKTELILAGGNLFSGQWKPFSSTVSHIFQGVLHPNQRKRIFHSNRMKVII